MASSAASFPNRPFNLRVDSWINWQSGRRASVHVNIWIDKRSYSPTYSYENKSSINVTLGGVSIATWGPTSYDFRNGNNFHIISVDAETNLAADGGVWVAGYANFDIMGYTETGHGLYGAAATVPPAPTQYQPTNVTTTSMQSTFSGNGDGGSPIHGWEQWWATDAAFTQNVQSAVSGGVTQLTGLTPGTTYFIRSRGMNAIGAGAWSNVVSQTTLPSVPPGLVVASSPSGTQATLTFSPPGGVTGVTKYAWERRATGTTTPVATGESAVTVVTVENLVPGNSYDWRASAWIGTYQSPWTGWTTLVQAKPNVNPGDYFDGSSADVADLDYSWTAAANASTSVATAKGVAGWSASFGNGAAGVIYRVTAGIFGTYAARVQVTADGSLVGSMHAGQGTGTEVTEAATYLGSIHVRPGRAQSLAAIILWYNAGGGFIMSTAGAATNVPGGQWIRLVAGGVAPAGAVSALIRATDVAGTGWSTWKGGDTLDLDGAMISLNEQFPYFDGSTLPDGTYVYEWEGDAHASQSTRTPLAQAQASAGTFSGLPAGRDLTDPDCSPVPPPPRPPAVPSDCIDDIGVWRRYYSAIPASLVPDWYDVVPTLEITSGALAARQVRIRYYANPADLPPGSVDTTTWISEQIISYMPAATVLTVNGMTQHVYAEIGDADPIAADHLMYGTNGQPATWPVLSCGISYLVSIEVPIAEPAGNIAVAASLTPRI